MTPNYVEFLGTSLLLGAYSFTGSAMITIAALLIAIALGGKISGGYFNPAIVLVDLMKGSLSKPKALGYIIAQLVAVVFIYAIGLLL